MEDLLVICDDINLPLGKLRLRGSGSSGGQKGLEDVIRRLGTRKFRPLAHRRRAAGGRLEWVDYVLSKFTKDEIPVVAAASCRAADAAADWAREGVQYCMNRYN